ncbi:MAG: hypothetical protein Q8N63_03950 [Nanoarchaeota archaeon]|nr:hypothetical protein [Nanoarchaeota archaeon]
MGYRVKHDGEIVKEERDSLSWLLGSYDKKIGEIHMTSNCRYYIVSGTIEAELKDDYDRDNRRT